MSKAGELLQKRKQDYDFKTVTGALLSLGVTAVFALYNGYLGIRLSSLWYGTVCVYYLILTGLRGILLSAEKEALPEGERERCRRRRFVAGAALLLLLNVSLAIPAAIMVRQQKPVDLTLIPAIAMAAYTTYKVTLASVHLRRQRRSANVTVRLLRIINFIDALVSILTLQCTLIAVNAGADSPSMRTLPAVTSGCIMLAILTISLVTLIRGIRRLRQVP